MFELTTATPAKITSVNPRAELHGKEPHPAVDIKFTVEQSNRVLDAFHPALRAALYAPSTELPSQQPELEGVEAASDLPSLRFVKLSSPLRWDLEITGATLTIDHGLGGKSNIVVSDAKVNAFAFECCEGGMVKVTFRVQCAAGLTEKLLGKIAMLVDHDVEIVLEGPDMDAQQEISPKEPERGEGWPFPVEGEKAHPMTPEQALADAVESEGGAA
jgi:hypothetical protein